MRLRLRNVFPNFDHVDRCELFCMHPLEPDEDDYLLCSCWGWDGLYPEETFGDRLQLFYQQFNSSTRALLDGAVFRETTEVSIVIGLEILCRNQIIYKRLIQKRQKITNELRWIWPETLVQFSIGTYTADWYRQTVQIWR